MAEVEFAKDRLAQTGRHAGGDDLDNTANRITVFPGLFDFLAHGRHRVRVNAAQFVTLNLFPHVALRPNAAHLNDAANYGYVEFCEQLFCQGSGNHAANRFAG